MDVMSLEKIKFYYYYWQVPAITIQLMPFAVLIGGIVTNWLLAKHGEISALRAAGMSMFLYFNSINFSRSLFFTMGHFVLNEFVLPMSTTHF